MCMFSLEAYIRIHVVFTVRFYSLPTPFASQLKKKGPTTLLSITVAYMSAFAPWWILLTNSPPHLLVSSIKHKMYTAPSLHWKPSSFCLWSPNYNSYSRPNELVGGELDRLSMWLDPRRAGPYLILNWLLYMFSSSLNSRAQCHLLLSQNAQSKSFKRTLEGRWPQWISVPGKYNYSEKGKETWQ